MSMRPADARSRGDGRGPRRVDEVLQAGRAKVISPWNQPENELLENIFQRFREENVSPQRQPVYLIDGSNIFFKGDGPIEYWPIRKAFASVRAAGPVIVVSSFPTLAYKLRPQIMNVMSFLDKLHGNKFSIFFASVDVRKCNEESPARGGGCIVRDYTKKPQQCTYDLPNGVDLGPDHAFCEFDDILITRMAARLREYGFGVEVVSKDRGLIKDQGLVEAVSYGLRELDASVKLSVEFVATNSSGWSVA